MIDYSRYTGDNIINLYELCNSEWPQFLASLRWGNRKSCPFCSSENPYNTNRGYKCSNNNCHRKFTVYTNTIFKNCKMFHLYFIIMVDMMMFEYPSTHYSKEGICTQKTAWLIQKKLKANLNLLIKEPIYQIEWLIKK